MSTAANFKRRQARVRTALRKRNTDRARLSVFRSNQHIHAQIIDDAKGVTLAQASTVEKDLSGKLKGTSNVEAAKQVGALIAERAKQAKITQVYFDRGAYIYHGRVKALADAARAGGLDF